jgi:quercetin dioxygenase-like cupin family protein
VVQQHPSLQLNPADEMLQVGVTGVHFLVTGEQSNGSIATFELTVPAQQKFPALPHSHDAYEETIYGIEGISTWTVDGVQFEVGPGQTLCIPRGAVHGFGNYHDVDTKALTIVSPAKIGPEFFREMVAILKESAGGPPDLAKMMGLMNRYGIKPAQPGR